MQLKNFIHFFKKKKTSFTMAEAIRNAKMQNSLREEQIKKDEKTAIPKKDEFAHPDRKKKTRYSKNDIRSQITARVVLNTPLSERTAPSFGNFRRLKGL